MLIGSKMKIINPEERDNRIQRQLEFLDASRAQHDARMAEISKKQEENARLIVGNSRKIAANSEQISQLAGFFSRMGRIVEEGFSPTSAFRRAV